jgi:thiosulfate/3-mercaptopyruvate sulfurtransferase
LPVLFVVLLPNAASARNIPPIASTDWLAAHLADPGLVVIDVRKVEYHREGHIPGAINIFFRAWSFKKGELYSQMPELDDLFEMIGSAGIMTDSSVVVVGKTDNMQEIVHASKVACTLQFAGVKHVAVLDGGHNKWAAEKRPVSTAVVNVKAKPYKSKVNPDMIADKQYVMDRLQTAILVDVREEDYFTGKKKMDCIEKRGHIPCAVNLPTSLVFTAENTYKSPSELAAIAASVIGNDKTKQIITYCDTGQCCPTWAFILKQVLGYQDVRVYDGALQEWVKDPLAPFEK